MLRALVGYSIVRRTPVLKEFGGVIRFSVKTMRSIGKELVDEITVRISEQNTTVKGVQIKRNSASWTAYKRQHGSEVPDHSLVAFQQSFLKRSSYTVKSSKNEVRIGFANRKYDTGIHARKFSGKGEPVLMSMREKVGVLYKKGYGGWFGISDRGKRVIIDIGRAWLRYLFTGKEESVKRITG